MITVTKVCPASKYENYQELEGAWGLSMSDHQAPRAPNYTDGTQDYYVMSGRNSETILSRAIGGVVERPEYDAEELIDIAKAQSAADEVMIYETPAEGESPVYDKTKIMCFVGMDAQAACALMGLERIQAEGGI